MNQTQTLASAVGDLLFNIVMAITKWIGIGAVFHYGWNLVK